MKRAIAVRYAPAMHLGGSIGRWLSCVLAAAAMMGCSFSNYQSAKMLPRGGTSVTGAFSFYSYDEGDGSADDEAIEIIASHGLTEQVELGGKLVWFTVEEGNAFNFLAVPKISLLPDRLALTIPAGMIVIEGMDDVDNAWMATPGLVFTQTLSPDFDLDVAAKPVFTFEDNFDDYNVAAAINIAIRLSPAGSAWALHPEFGLMYDDDSEGPSGDTGYFMQIGFAFTYEILPQGAAPAP